ncbi:MAG: hypothetical protein ACKVT2_09615 [Saprospiraceae bacterium]
MKYISIFLFAILIIASCQNNTDPKTGDSNLNEQGIQADAPKTPEEMKELATKSGVEMSNSDIVGNVSGPVEGTIIGANVAFRKGATITSEKMGTLAANESVVFHGNVIIEDEAEAILSQSVAMKGSSGSVTLSKGKPVFIEKFKAGSKTYLISFEDPQKGKLSAQVSASAVESITNASWAQVERKSGEKGWIFSKNVKSN